MSEKRVMRIKRGLMKGAKKLRLGAKRTGAYVYGTLRRIVGNPGDSDLIDGAVDVIINTRDFCGNEKQAVRDYCFENKVSDCKGLYRMAMAKANSKWNAYRREAGVRCVRRNPYLSRDVYYDMGYAGTAVIPKGTRVDRATNLATPNTGRERYWARGWRGMKEREKSWVRNYGYLIEPKDVVSKRPLRGNPRLGKYEQKALNFARKYPGWHGFDPRKPTANIVRRLEKKGLVKVSDISNQFRAI